jgi:exosortase
MALAVKILVLTAAITAFYFQDLSLAFTNAVNDEATSYILIIPMIFAYLIYRKRKMLTAAITDTTQNQPRNTRLYSTLAGTLLVLTAVILYWHGSYTFTPLEYHLATLPIFTAGLALVLFNPQTLKQVLFPIAFLIFLTPPPSEIFYDIGSLLSVLSSEVSTTIVQAFKIPATLTSEYGTPTILITRPDNTTMTFAVDIACSGIYSLIGFLVFAVFITYIVRDKPWKKAAIFTIGFPLMYLLNIIRITIIVTIGYNIGEQFALDLFHLLGGWTLILIGTIILLAISEGILKIDLFSNKHKQTCPNCPSNIASETRNYCTTCGRILKHQTTKLNTKDTAKLAITITAILLLLWIQMPVFATTLSPAPVMISTPDGESGNTQLFPQINGYDIQYLYRDTHFENISKQDYSIIFQCTPTNDSEPPIWIGLEVASTTTALHRWETCLVVWPQTRGYQSKVTQLDLRDTQILDNPPIIARYFAFQYSTDNQTQLVLYWYETSTFTVDNATQQKQVELSLITYPQTPQDIQRMENQLLPIAQAIANYWQPMKTWASISVLISQHGLELATATTIILIILVTLYIFEIRRQTKAGLNVYQKLGKNDQQLVDTIRGIQKTSIPTLDAIRNIYNKKARVKLKADQLEQKLTDLQKTDAIRNIIVNNRDEPTRIWKA